MLSTDPSYDNRTIASTLKMQIWIGTNNRNVPRVMKIKFPAMVMVFGVVLSEGHIMPPHIFEAGLKVNTKVYLDVLKSVVIPWQTLGVAAGLSASPQVQRHPGLASEGVLRLCTLLSASLIAAICRVFTELLPVLVEKACSQFQICIKVVIEAEGSYIE